MAPSSWSVWEAYDMSVDFYKIKAIIWNLDETFWQGTLSAHNQPVKKVLSNIELVKKLSNGK